MCLADFNNDGDNLLALIDFKRGSREPGEQVAKRGVYSCRLRVYRGQQLIYNHFLDDAPSSLLATSVRTSLPKGQVHDQANLTMTINDDIYFYQGLRPSHRISLEDDQRITSSINRSELEAWQMVRQNKVDVETMRDLLTSLGHELGPAELTCHSRNFLSLGSAEERNNYLLSWKFKRLNNGAAEHLMSMDSICCSAARLRFSSALSQSGDFGSSREPLGLAQSNPRWNRILDVQRDGLVVGTEDRHLLIYEQRLSRTRLEAHYRLASVPDHLLVERRAPESFELKSDLRQLTYKILISCRNRRIYALDQHYLVDENREAARLVELLALKSSAVELSWLSQGCELAKGVSCPRFAVACSDRRVYCYSSLAGQCQWIINTEDPITCIACIPGLAKQEAGESDLLAVASRANRVDLFLGASGRIVDSIYLAAGDHCSAIKFGRFGREDNCLCMVTAAGSLMILILKRTAKFGHGQCLSSSGAFAMSALASQASLVRRARLRQLGSTAGHQVRLPEAPGLARPSGAHSRPAGQVEHECDSVSKQQLADYLATQRVELPKKGRHFVGHIVRQSRHSAGEFFQ